MHDSEKKALPLIVKVENQEPPGTTDVGGCDAAVIIRYIGDQTNGQILVTGLSSGETPIDFYLGWIAFTQSLARQLEGKEGRICAAVAAAIESGMFEKIEQAHQHKPSRKH